ncbi:MAG: DUF1587 domain-containing protein, partial [Acidobacteriaceae bacterium]|nr:DUF1587 domain-containing protein [Acidobacteriaceae bacterium]
MKTICFAVGTILAAHLAFGQPLPVAAQKALVTRYCAACHNDKLQSGSFSWSPIDLANPGAHAEQLERAIRKLRAGMMPPSGMPRPAKADLLNFASALEQGVDEAAARNLNPGHPALHRLNRTEYANAVHDLLALDIDVASLLPPDDMSHGFDNMSDVLSVSP